MVVTLAGIVISCKLVQYRNTCCPIEVKEDGKLTDSKPEHLINNPELNDLIPDGMVMVVNDEQPLKTDAPKEVTEPGSVILTKLEQFSNT